MSVLGAAGSVPDWLAPAGGSAFLLAITTAVITLVRYILRENRRTSTEQARLLVKPLSVQVRQLQRRDGNCREAMQLVTTAAAQAGVPIPDRVWDLLRDNGERDEDEIEENASG